MRDNVFFDSNLWVYLYSYYDGLIIASALKNNCATLYTEDMHNQQVIEGLKIVNPFVS